MRTHILLAAVLASAACTVIAQQTARISFEKGARSAFVEGAAVRGEQATYLIALRAGQELEIAISSTENNAVFAVFPPASEVPLADEVGRRKGRLEKTGDYKIVVGGTRGNATYKLNATVY